MKKLNVPILQALITLMCGIILYEYFPLEDLFIYGALCILFLIALCLHLFARRFIFSEIPFITILSFLLVTTGYLTRLRADDLQNSSHYHHLQNVSPQSILVTIKEHLKPTLYQDKYVGEIKQVAGTAVSGLILINVNKDSLQRLPKIGEWYHIRSQILPLPTPKNPYQFDYGNYLEKQQIYGQLSLNSSALLRSELYSSNLRVWSARFRESIQEALRSKPFTKQQLAIIEALVLGQKQGIDKEISKQYAAAGMMHILAVSGLHVGIILMLLRFITRPIARRKLKLLRSVLIVVCIWGFAFVAGLSPSVMRAATMFTFLEIGTALGGKRKSRDAVLVSALLLLLYDPLLIYQVGFQLSYLAVLSILWIQPWLEDFYTPRFWIDRMLWGTTTVTIAAQIGVMPLSLYYFHQFPGLFFISNIVILPFLGIILSCGIFISFLALLGWLPDFLIKGYGSIIDLMNSFIRWVAMQEGYVAEHITISLLFLAALYVMIVIVIALLQKFEFPRLWAACIALALFTIVWVYDNIHPEQPHLAIINKSKSTILARIENQSLRIYSNDSLLNIARDSRVNSYRDGITIKEVIIDSISNYIRFKQKELLIIDSLGIYQLTAAQPDYILLRQSPKINLNRLLTRYPKITLIADASNYRTDVDRWRATCRKLKIPFHSTYEKGAFLIQ